jgi:hypothetical protein
MRWSATSWDSAPEKRSASAGGSTKKSGGRGWRQGGVVGALCGRGAPPERGGPGAAVGGGGAEAACASMPRSCSTVLSILPPFISKKVSSTWRS